MHKSFGERPRVDGCSENFHVLEGRIAHLVLVLAQVTSRGGIAQVMHCTSHK